MENYSGQAVLIVLLSMVVALTAVLSIIASSTADIKISANETASLRAFSAAESGIEKALIANSASSGSLNNASFTSNISSLAEGLNNFNYPSNITSGDSSVFWFVSHASDGSLVCDASHPCFTGHTIQVCWGAPGTNVNLATTPAIELSAFYLNTPGNYTTTKLVKATFDPNLGRISTNSFAANDAGACTIGSVSYAFQKQVDLATLGVPAGSYAIANGLQFMSVRMLYNTDVPQPLGINVNFVGNSPLPSQGNLIDSTGSLNGSTRKVEVRRAFNQAPSVFIDTSMYSAQGLIQ
jgi:Tfp pilus assembly protein PilX